MRHRGGRRVEFASGACDDIEEAVNLDGVVRDESELGASKAD